MFVTDGFFANGLDVDEGAAEGSFRLGFVAVEEVELVEVGGGPLDDVGFGGVEMEFVGGLDAGAAVEVPARVGGLVDEGGVLGAKGLVESEGLVEEEVEFIGVFAGDEEGLGGAAVEEGVEGGGRCVISFCAFWLKDEGGAFGGKGNLAVSC